MIGAPPGNCPSSAASMPWVIIGTPAMMKMLSTLMPGALVRGFSIRLAPAGVRAMRSRASVNWSP